MEGKITTVLMTTDTVGGVWAYTLELCRALKSHGVNIHLAAMGTWPSEVQQQEAAKLTNVLLYKSDYKLEWMQDPWEDVAQAGKWLNAIYQTVQPDLIHFNNYAHMGREWDCPTVTVFHSCVQTWWQAVKGTSAPSTWKRYLETVRDSLNSSNVVVGPTKAILEQAKESHNILSPTRVIYNGGDITFQQGIQKEDIILCVGRIWDEAKNLKTLSGIAVNLPWPVYVVGNNVNPNTGEKIEIENVHFLGELAQEEAQEWMQRAKIFVSPTKYEPFGLAILEAAEAGCVLILSDLDTLKEIWQETAIFFKPDNKEEAVQKILEVTGSAAMQEEFSEKAKMRASGFSAEKMAIDYFELYGELINKRTKSPELAPTA